jgi:hypothetical protein
VSDEVSTDELLRSARQAGVDVSEAQLARWHRAGLIPRPRVQRLGRGKGTRSLYPSGTAERLIRVAQIHQQEHRLAQTAWRLWWEDGGPLTAPGRQFLRQRASRLDAERQQIVELFEGDQSGDSAASTKMDELFAALQHGPLPKPLGGARRRSGSEKFPAVGRIILEVAAHRFDGFSVDSETGEDDAEVLERSLGLERARTDRLANADPWLEGDLGPDLAKLSDLLESHSNAGLAELGDAELETARSELHNFQAIVLNLTEMFTFFFGPEAFGYSMLSSLFKFDTPDAQSRGLLGWLLLRQNAALYEGMLEFGGLAPQAKATARLQEITQQLRQDVPAFADVLSPERLGAAQLNAEEGERLRVEISAVAEANREQVDSFLEQFPEIDDLLQLAGDGSGPRP